MKHINQLTLLITLIVMISLSSCKKDAVETSPLTSLTVANAVVGGTTAKLGNYILSIPVNNTNGTQIVLKAGENNLYFWPLGDSLHPYFIQNKFNAEDRAVYSLFLCGIPGATEGILQKETIPYRTDSTTGIRFINLAPSSTPLNITLSTSTTVNEVANLGYKQMTEFKSYPGLYNSAFTFQVRAANNPNVVLASQAFTAATVPRFANITLVIRQNGTGVAVFRVNNDR